MYIYIEMCLYECVNAHIYTYTVIYISAYRCIYAYISLYTFSCTHVCVQVCTHACICICKIYACMYMYVINMWKHHRPVYKTGCAGEKVRRFYLSRGNIRLTHTSSATGVSSARSRPSSHPPYRPAALYINDSHASTKIRLHPPRWVAVCCSVLHSVASNTFHPTITFQTMMIGLETNFWALYACWPHRSCTRTHASVLIRRARPR